MRTLKTEKLDNGELGFDIEQFSDIYDTSKIEYVSMKVTKENEIFITFFDKNKKALKPRKTKNESSKR